MSHFAAPSLIPPRMDSACTNPLIDPHTEPRYTNTVVDPRETSMSIAAAQHTLGRVFGPWWLWLLTGLGWMLVGLIVLRFDYTSVSAIATLFGFVAIAAGVLEFVVMALAQRWWKLLHAAVAVIFIAAGIVAFI